jgi:hypothetical protein
MSSSSRSARKTASTSAMRHPDWRKRKQWLVQPFQIGRHHDLAADNARLIAASPRLALAAQHTRRRKMESPQMRAASIARGPL